MLGARSPAPLTRGDHRFGHVLPSPGAMSMPNPETDITKIMGDPSERGCDLPTCWNGRRIPGSSGRQSPAEAPISRSRSGRAAPSSQSRAFRRSAMRGVVAAARSRSTSSTAQAKTYSSSCSASSSLRATTSSRSLSWSSAARWRATQSHWRQRCEQNSRGRPGPSLGGSVRRHHRQLAPPPTPLSNCVMTLL